MGLLRSGCRGDNTQCAERDGGEGRKVIAVLENQLNERREFSRRAEKSLREQDRTDRVPGRDGRTFREVCGLKS